MSVLDSFSLNNKVVLVTGGAGLYGRQIVEAAAEAGADTWVASRNPETLEKLKQECAGRGLNISIHTVDQADEESILSLKKAIENRSGRLDVLVNNAVARPMKGYDDDIGTFDESMRVNATGLFAMTRIMGDFIAESSRNGSIINVGSIMGMIGPDPTNYNGTAMSAWYPDYFFHKGGMINFSRFVASYYGDKGMRCNTVSPGGLYQETMPEAFVKNYSERTLLGRLAGNTDLKGVIVFLASDASQYITGANIPVDGGYTAK